jgi:hypothetical protein
VNPSEDPSWPNCSHHNSKHWCDAVAQYLREGHDDDLDFGMRYCVPIVPSHGHYAEVSIDTTVINNISAPLHLVMPSDPFNFLAESTEYLGLWTRGEGRLIIASTIADWIHSHEDLENCQGGSHNFSEEMSVQKMRNERDPDETKANNWCMAYYGFCMFCYENLQNVGRAAAAVTAADVGLDSSSFRGNAGARMDQTRQALKNRFGN